MFQESDEAIAQDAAAKLDRAAATQRSTIRRQPTVRPSRYTSSGARERIRDRYHSGGRSDPDMVAELQIRQMEAEIARLRNRRSNGRDQNTSLRDAEALVQQSRSTFPEDENEERSDARTRRLHLPRPNRESSLRFEVSAPRSSSLSPHRLSSRSSQPHRHTSIFSPPNRLSSLLSPPSSSGGGQTLPDGPSPPDESPTLTAGFAPAWYDEDQQRSLDLTPPPETWESSLPPLNRWARRPEHPPHRSIDGLGDRHRSPSPDLNAEEETWANLLTTLEPGRSSTATSFASNGDPGSRSRNSQSTMATSFGEIGADDGCDLDLPSGITEEIAREIREQHRSRDRQHRRNGEPDGPIMTGEQGLRMHEARVRQAREAREGSRQIQMIQQIMERYGSREDVPDDWWTIVGWDDDGGSEPPRAQSRSSRRPVAETNTADQQRENSSNSRDQRSLRTLRRAQMIMQELRSQTSQDT